MKEWSPTKLNEKRIRISAKVVGHARCVAFQMTQAAVPKAVLAKVLEIIAERRP
jgi:hypothetical protein